MIDVQAIKTKVEASECHYPKITKSEARYLLNEVDRLRGVMSIVDLILADIAEESLVGISSHDRAAEIQIFIRKALVETNVNEFDEVKDMNGNTIKEGDTIHCWSDDNDFVGIVEIREGIMGAVSEDGIFNPNVGYAEFVEVIQRGKTI